MIFKTAEGRITYVSTRSLKMSGEYDSNTFPKGLQQPYKNSVQTENYIFSNATDGQRLTMIWNRLATLEEQVSLIAISVSKLAKRM